VPPPTQQVKAGDRLDSARSPLVASPGDLRLPRPEAPTHKLARRLVFASSLLALASCGPWQRVGAPEPKAAGGEQVTALSDPTAVYRQMGFVTGAGQIPFVGSVRLLASRSPDSAIAVVALSLQDRQLTFQRDANAFSAGYRVEVTFRRGVMLIRQVIRDERVVVATFRETQRAEESVIFQEFVSVAAGDYQLSIIVRDRNGPNVGRYETAFTVPPLQPPSISTPIAVYQATPRTDLAAAPDLVVNPRSTVAFGADSARFYVETYGLPARSTVVVSALDAGGSPVWADTSRLDSAAALHALLLTMPPAHLSMGRYEIRVALEGGGAVATAPFLEAFSGQWVVANFEEMVSLLRYFTSPDTLKALASAPPEARAAAWKKFLHDTDPNPDTPENEALERYFARLQLANEQFRDEGMPGWLTDRGEVFITLGEPDEVLDRRSEMQGRGRQIIWTYTQLRLTLIFVDDSGFGRFRLDPGSRSEFHRIANRLRRSQ
jgi:GWxTD domain-containing protein